MSILIKGMEMPKNCENCPFCDNDAMCTVLGEDLFDHVQAEVADNLRYLPEDWKSDSCPLVLVPPHGRLIDGDKLRKAEFIHDGDAYAVVMSRDIRNAPTIIPADPEEEEMK